MKFFTGSNETMLDKVTDASRLMHANPDYYRPRFDAIAELRAMDDGSLHRGNEFRRVASLVNVPIITAIRICEPQFLSDKRKFYAWLAKHPEYKTYEHKGGSRPSITVADGEAVSV